MADIEKRITLTVSSFMKDNRLNQSDIGKILGVGQSSVARRFTGKCSWLVKDVEALAAVGVDFSNLFTGEVRDV